MAGYKAILYIFADRVAFVEGATFPKDSEMPKDRTTPAILFDHSLKLLRLLLQERLIHTQPPQRQKEILSSLWTTS
jgi:hypothetical protein